IQGTAHWAVETNKAGFFVDGLDKGRDIAESDQNLGVVANQVVIQKGQYPGASIASSGAENPIDLWIGEHLVQIQGTLLVRITEISIIAQDARGMMGLEAHFLQGFQCFLQDVCFDGKTWGDQSDGIPFF